MCNVGYIGDGTICAVGEHFSALIVGFIDSNLLYFLDECSQGYKRCANQSYCQARYTLTDLGSLVTAFRCICKDGYYGDGDKNCSRGNTKYFSDQYIV